MAGRAGVTKATIVGIVIVMTVAAGLLRINKLGGCMTCLAFLILMITQQRKRRQTVIKEWRFLPNSFCVAVFALLTQLPGMRLIALVTGCAVVTR